jgi:hypothetical protein
MTSLGQDTRNEQLCTTRHNKERLNYVDVVRWGDNIRREGNSRCGNTVYRATDYWQLGGEQEMNNECLDGDFLPDGRPLEPENGGEV